MVSPNTHPQGASRASTARSQRAARPSGRQARASALAMGAREGTWRSADRLGASSGSGAHEPALRRRQRGPRRWAGGVRRRRVRLGDLLGSNASSAGTRTATVTRSTLTASVTATGNAQPATDASLAFTSSGRVTAVNVAVGDHVTEGQVLARIDAETAQAAVASAKAQLPSAESNLDQTTAGQTADAAQKDALAVRQAQLALDRAKTDLSQAKAQQSLDAVQQAQNVAAAKKSAATGTSLQVSTSALVARAGAAGSAGLGFGGARVRRAPARVGPARTAPVRAAPVGGIPAALKLLAGRGPAAAARRAAALQRTSTR